MKKLSVRIFLLLFFVCSAFSVSATKISGKITDRSGDGLPYVAIYIKGTSKGTTSNVNGEYSYPLTPGKYTIVFQLLGYATHSEEVDLTQGDKVVNVTLGPSQITLKEVAINADGEDPAYAVIRQAIKKRKYYQDQVAAYSCDVYIKGLQRVKEHPDKILGMDVNIDEDIDSTTGIIYLSESVSKFNFKQSDKIKEEMISSKVSGDNRAFSYNRASDMMFNFYDNLMEIDGLSERGFVSPIANNALFFYKYHLVGTFFEGEKMINKIEVIPKRKADPVFRGFIYIVENDWRIHSTDLYLTKDAQIDFVDTLVIDQAFVPVEGDVWMVFTNKFKFNFGFMGFKGNGMFVGVNKNYTLNPDFPKRFFDGEEMKVTDEANKKDTAYWKDTRPVPLTPEEEHDYKWRDSITKVHESKPYLDSVDKKRNKPKIMGILFTGYNFNRSFEKLSFNVSPMIQNVSFNTVQGWRGGLDLSWSKRWENHHWYSISPDVSYGFSDHHWNGNITASWLYNPVKFERVSFSAGHDAVQFNGKAPISRFVNSLYTLLDENNYMKLYRKTYASFDYRSELINGLVLNSTLSYADRQPLKNRTDYVLWDHENRNYASNNPLDPFDRDSVASFTEHQALTLDLNFRITFKQKYYTRPNQKIILGSKYPTLGVNYRRGIPVAGAKTDYDFLRLSIHDEINLKLLGHLTYTVAIGKFLTSKYLPFMDYYHFNGNKTLWSMFGPTDFQLLDYYTYSNNSQFAEAHVEQDFGGFILNKLPLIRKLKLNEIAGIHYMTDTKDLNYLEVFFGLSKLQAVRADFVMGFMQNKQVSTGFRFGLMFN